MDKDKTRETVKNIFTEYLTVKKCRKTAERFAILDLIYTEKRYFDMNSLYEAMNDRNFRVSRSTLYNTMELLLECKLVLKHQFGTNISYFERAYDNDFHSHLICNVCGKIEQYENTGVKKNLTHTKTKGFEPSYYCLYIFGTCNKCKRAFKIKEKNILKSK